VLAVREVGGGRRRDRELLAVDRDQRARRLGRDPDRARRSVLRANRVDRADDVGRELELGDRALAIERHREVEHGLRLGDAPHVTEHRAEPERRVRVEDRAALQRQQGLGVGARAREARCREVDLHAQERAPGLVDPLAEPAKPLERRDRDGPLRDSSARRAHRVVDDAHLPALARRCGDRGPHGARVGARGRDRHHADALGAGAARTDHRDPAREEQLPHAHEYTRVMHFEWLDSTPGRPNGSKLRAEVAIAELANRAGTMFRLGFSQASATARLCARVAWEFDPPSKKGFHKRPAALSDQAIAKIVADTYARRPGGW
jgi:hypothetical protein